MKKLLPIIFLLLISINGFGQRQSEQLSRGLVAVKTSSGVYLSWRITGQEWFDVSYNIYKNGTKLNSSPITASSNYKDSKGGLTDQYAITAIVSGTEQAASSAVTPWENPYLDIPINRPAGGTVDGSTFTYSANDASTADLDGDGELDVILKWDPSNSKDNSHSGFTGSVILDAYKMDGTHLWRVDLGRNIRAGAHYTQFLVYDYDGDGKAEMICKTADGTVDGKGTIIGDANADYRNSSGRVLSGPEFLTVFDGVSGEALSTINYEPARGSVSQWGDSYGNRVDRFLAGVAYLDGEHPSAVMGRGYYERTMLAAFDWDGTNLTRRWLFNSESGGLTDYSGQGNHSLSIGDVDNDGKDEIIYGQMTIDHDGTGLYSTKLHHGDALHVTDHDPDIPGLEVVSPHEDGKNGITLRSGETGEIYWQYKSSDDVGRAVACNILPNYRGSEVWATSGLGMYNAKGEYVEPRPGSINFCIYWDADVERELLDGVSIKKISTTILTATGMHSCNGTKSTPTLQADLFGDWREEVVWASNTENFLRVYTATSMNTKRVYSLMHDSQYRMAVAWQNVGYNQPPHPSFMLENDLALPMPEVFSGIKWQGNAGANQWNGANNFTKDNTAVDFQNGDVAVFSFDGVNNETVEITEDISPSLVVVSSPDDYTFSGNGAMQGEMSLYKHQKGSLTISGEHSYSGASVVSDGALILNGTLENSDVSIIGGIWGGSNTNGNTGGRIGGNGTIKQSLNIRNRAALIPGMQEPDTLWVGKDLSIENYAVAYFDLAADANAKSDVVMVGGNISIANNVTLKINLKEGKLNAGNHILFYYDGAFTGDTETIKVEGLDGIFYWLKAENGKVFIKIDEPRLPQNLIWTAKDNNVWGLNGKYNWTNNGVRDYYMPNDSVVFPTQDDYQEVLVDGVCEVGAVTFDASSNYTLSGDGEISGSGSLMKKNKGRLSIANTNSYSGKTTILNGVLSIPQLNNGELNSALGKAGISASKLEINGGILEISGSSTSSNKGITLGQSGGSIMISEANTKQSISGIISGEGDLYKKGEGTLALAAANTYNGKTILEGGTIELLSDNANENGLGKGVLIIKNGTLIQFDNSNTTNSSNFRIEVPANAEARYVLDSRSNNQDSIFGSGTLNLETYYSRTNLQGNWSSFSGTINVNADADGGDFRVDNSYGYPNIKIYLGDNVNAYRAGNDTIRIGQLTGSEKATLNNSIWMIGARNVESQYDGKIIGGQLIKEGTSRFILSNGNNTYAGGTILKSGSLWLSNQSGSATGSGPVIVKSGGVIGGEGFSGSQINLEAGAYISPGNPIGTFSSTESLICEKNSIVNIELDPENSSCDQLKAAGISLQSAMLFLINVSTVGYAIGEEFKILSANTIEGQFAAIYPQQPADGLYWVTDKLYTEGIISVSDQQPSALDQQIKSALKIYPNPADERLYIEHPDANMQNAKFNIFNLNGALVKSSAVLHNGSIDVSKLPEGIYILNVKINSSNVSYRISII